MPNQQRRRPLTPASRSPVVEGERASWAEGADAVAALVDERPDWSQFVVWTSDELDDQLHLWWLLDAFERARVDPRRLELVQLSLHAESGDFPRGVGTYGGDELDRGFESRRPVSSRMLRVGAALWRRFASKSPVRLDAARREGRIDFPNLRKTLKPWSTLFPRLGDDGRVHLSDYDRLLLSVFDTREWRRPHDGILHWMEGTRLGGDQRFLIRLVDWADHRRAEPVLEWRPSDGVNDFTRVEYRLTETGRRLLNGGLDCPDDAPSMFIGGCELYGQLHPWVRQTLEEEPILRHAY